MLKTAAQMLEESYALNGGFGFATSIWELCLIQRDGHHKMGIDENAVFRFFQALKKEVPRRSRSAVRGSRRDFPSFSCGQFAGKLSFSSPRHRLRRQRRKYGNRVVYERPFPIGD